MKNARLDELQAGTKIDRKNINNLKYVDDITLMVESKEALKNLLKRRREEESEKTSLKQNKTHCLLQPPSSILRVLSGDFRIFSCFLKFYGEHAFV